MSGERIHGAESWRIESDRARAWVTKEAGMVAPVEFMLGDRRVSPYALAPWQPEDFGGETPALLRVLRGDFFCLPFGPQEDGPPHGDPANACWEEIEAEGGTLRIGQRAGDSGARLERTIALRKGETNLYGECRISDLDGEWSYGNHPILDASQAIGGKLVLSVSDFRWGSVFPGVFSDPARGERQGLEGGAKFTDLREVPAAGGTADLGVFPSLEKCDDLVMMANAPTTERQPFAWSAANFGDYVWFSLKDPEDFPATLFWLSNGGRDGAPWNGRHVGRVGIEEVCSHFCNGVERSREGGLDVPTVRRFRRDEVVTLRIVQGVVAVPAGFGRVAAIEPAGDGLVSVRDEAGGSVLAGVDWSFVLQHQ